jgi:hypothetical protein
MLGGELPQHILETGGRGVPPNRVAFQPIFNSPFSLQNVAGIYITLQIQQHSRINHPGCGQLPRASSAPVI